MFPDISIIPQDIPKVLKSYNRMEEKYHEAVSKVAEMICYQKRCEFYEKVGARNFEYHQTKGFDPQALVDRIKMLETQIEGLKTEKGHYVNLAGNLKTNLNEAEQENSIAELTNATLRKIVDEQERENGFMTNFIKFKGLFDELTDFIAADGNPKIQEKTLKPQPFVRRQGRSGVLKRLDLNQSMDTLSETVDEEITKQDVGEDSGLGSGENAESKEIKASDPNIKTDEQSSNVKVLLETKKELKDPAHYKKVPKKNGNKIKTELKAPCPILEIFAPKSSEKLEKTANESSKGKNGRLKFKKFFSFGRI